jgi:hypothetical protein
MIKDISHRLTTLAFLLAASGWVASTLASQDLVEKIKAALNADSEIVFTVNQDLGIPIDDFIKMAQHTTDKVFKFDEKAVTERRVIFGGTVRVKRSEFLPFVQAMLYRVGLDCVPHNDPKNTETLIVPLGKSAPRIAPIRAAHFVQSTKLETTGSRSDIVVLTSIPVPAGSIPNVAAMLDTSAPRGVQFGRPSSGARILLQGPGTDVLRANRMIQRIVVGTAPFQRMIPWDACAAAEFEASPKFAAHRILEFALGKEARKDLEEGLARTRRYKSTAQLIEALHASLESRIGIVLRCNMRSESTQKLFPVESEHATPQWAFLFRLKTDEKGRPLTKPFLDLYATLNENRRAFGIRAAFKLFLKNRSDNALEFAVPRVPATGCLAIGVVGRRAFISNSGPFLHKIINASGEQSHRPKFRAVAHEKDPRRGLVWVNRRTLPELLEDLGDRKETVAVLEQGELDRWLRLTFGN